MAIYIAQKEDLVSEYDDSGFAKKEALPGTYEGGIRNYKCFLKAGCQVEPEMYEDKLVLFFFGKGTGYITLTAGSKVCSHKVGSSIAAFHLRGSHTEPWTVPTVRCCLYPLAERCQKRRCCRSFLEPRIIALHPGMVRHG